VAEERAFRDSSASHRLSGAWRAADADPCVAASLPTESGPRAGVRMNLTASPSLAWEEERKMKEERPSVTRVPVGKHECASSLGMGIPKARGVPIIIFVAFIMPVDEPSPFDVGPASAGAVIADADLRTREQQQQQHQQYQLAELALLRASVLPPDESFSFISESDTDGTDPDNKPDGSRSDTARWEAALHAHAGLSPGPPGPDALYSPEGGGALSAAADGGDTRVCAPTGPARFALRIRNAPVWFDVALPAAYAGSVTEGWPIVRARGVDAPLGKAEAAHWEDVVRAKQIEVSEANSE
jgi:hypothetical protein